MFRAWKPSNLPTPYDEARVAQLEPIRAALEALRLPLIRFKKLNAILGALEAQIEVGGDSPQVNALLLQALRAAVLHQVEESPARGALGTIEAFERSEARRWKQVRAGPLPPIKRTPEQQMYDLIHEGHGLLRKDRTAPACDRWLQAWELLKGLITPETPSVMAFDEAHSRAPESIFNWSSDLEMELGNAGMRDPAYHEHRLRYVRELLARFPGEDADRCLQFRRAEAEALWHLKRRNEAEEVSAETVARFPDQAWAYIGWADGYWLWNPPDPAEYERGEEILQRALARPGLLDRADVLDRLADLYAAWGRPEQQAAVIAQQKDLQRKPESAHRSLASSAPSPKAPSPRTPSPHANLGRNDPCWCGSGKKYKHCHRPTDQRT